MRFREESDFLGIKKVPSDALYGVHSARAAENFALGQRRVAFPLIRFLALIKKAAARANGAIGELDSESVLAIGKACDEIVQGLHADAFIVEALQGGAGTATNMNMNEVIANRANEILGDARGSYRKVHPLAQVNRGQSTNDVVPSAFRLACFVGIQNVMQSCVALCDAIHAKSIEFSDVLKLGRTQLQDALPITLGAEFGAYEAALRRDVRRLSAVQRNLLSLSLGGTAIGTCVGASYDFRRQFLVFVREETGLEVRASENLVDAVQNADVFAEVSGALRVLGLTLSKMASDMRLLASGPHGGLGEIVLPTVQEGSSIMPGKANPVMCEMINQIAFRVLANDLLVSQCTLAGELELNAFTPASADALLESLHLLERGMILFAEKCVIGIVANRQRCLQHLSGSLVVLTLLSKRLGHERMAQIYRQHLETGRSAEDLLVENSLVSREEIAEVLRQGY